MRQFKSVQRIFCTLLLSVLASCKFGAATSSHAASLTTSETASCKFTGKRFLLIITPEQAFQGDVNLIQGSFTKYLPTPLIDRAHIASLVAADPSKQQACTQLYGASLANYDRIDMLTGTSASSQSLAQYLDAIGTEITNFRATAAGTNAEIQITIALTAHGIKYDGNYQDGALVLGQHDFMHVPDFAQLIYSKLMTKCQVFDPTCQKPGTRLADEILLFMDNCYSGNLSDGLQAVISTQPGYHEQIGADTLSLATRIVALAAASRGQTQAGGNPGLNGGTLYTILDEMISSWNADNLTADSQLSATEVINYMTSTAYVRYAGEARAALINILRDTICTNKSRSALAQSTANRKSYFTGLYQNTDATLSTSVSMFAGTDAPLGTAPADPTVTPDPTQQNSLPALLAIQQPSYYSNLTSDNLSKFYLSINNQKAGQTKGGGQLFQQLSDPAMIRGMKQDIGSLVQLLAQVDNALSTNSALLTSTTQLTTADLNLPTTLQPAYNAVITQCSTTSNSVSGPDAPATHVPVGAPAGAEATQPAPIIPTAAIPTTTTPSTATATAVTTPTSGTSTN